MSLRESFIVDETDLKIVSALQIQPRAAWSQVAGVVGIDPATAARRWRRLASAGAAWISCYPAFEPTTVFAYVEIDCHHGQIGAVAGQLAADPHAMTININAGGRDLLLEVVTRTPRDMARYVLERLAAVEGIRMVRTHPVIKTYREASRWRLRAIDAASERRLRGARPEVPPLSSVTLTEQHWALADALARDPRIGVAELGAELGVSPATARRRLDQMLGGQAMLRCELVRTLSGWPVHATFFAACPADRIDSTARALSQLPEVRAITSTAGPHNLFIAVWLRSLVNVQELEAKLAVKLPQLSITDRAVVIRPVKVVGQLLDEDGWAVGNVPVDIRRDPVPTGGEGWVPGKFDRQGGRGGE